MRPETLQIGFVPLIDAAPLVVATEMGFAEEEALFLQLLPAPSWSTLRDQLCFGKIDAAHMLAPVPIAGALGLGGVSKPIHAISVLSINGNVIGVSPEIAAKMRSKGHDFAFSDAAKAGQALIKAMGNTLRIGVPFPFSMHAELVSYWLSALGLPASKKVIVRTVPPSQMEEAMQAGELDAFCVGEPWGSRSVDAGVAELLLPASAIWAFAPEKVLAVRADWGEQNPDLAHRLIRAVWRASRWLAQPGSRMLAAEMLSQPNYLNLPVEVIERGLLGRFLTTAGGKVRQSDGFLHFFDGAAGFPWRSQAEWIGDQLATRLGLDRSQAVAAARETFRSDIYREALSHTARGLPSASAKLEGAVEVPTAVGSVGGRLILPRDQFFDGRIFEPFGA